LKPDNSLFFQKSPALPFVEMRRANQSTACYDAHSHDEFSFGVIDEGEAAYSNQRHKDYIGSGDIVTINPGDVHSCNPNEGRWSYRMLFVDSHWLGGVQKEMLTTNGNDYQLFSEPLSHANYSCGDFSQLFNSLLDPTHQLEAESLLIQFIEKQFVTYSSINDDVKKTEPSRIQWVKELIMDQLEENLTLDNFVDQTGLSRFHIIRSFKQKYGQTPHAFQLDNRIKKAKTLLRSGASLVDVSSQLGFADQAHFQRHFKKRIAVTPKQYQSFF